MSQTKITTTFLGFRSPNYTQVPDDLFDELMSELAGAELKVLLYIIRRTFGFKKTSEHISLSQIRHGITTRDGRVLDRGTGLSLSAAQSAIKALVAKGIILAQRNRSAQRGDEATTYRLHLLSPGDGGVQVDTASTVTESRQGGIPITGTGGYRKSVTQETVSQQTAVALRSSKAARAQREKGAGSRPPDKPEHPTAAASPRAAQPVRTGEVRSVAEVFRHHPLSGPAQAPVPQASQPTAHRAPTPQIAVAITEISQEFGDSTHLRANTTQAVHLWELSGCSEAMLVSRLYEARSITRQQPRVVNRRSYFWAVVRDLLGVGSSRLAAEP